MIQTAMLGTGKKQLSRDELPEDLAAVYDAVNRNEQADNEERFLQMTAAAANYRRCGVLPQYQPLLVTDIAAAETLPYCKTASAQALKAVLDEDNRSLLLIWLRLCSQHSQLAPPVLLPQLLDKTAKHKDLRTLVSQCAGNRGIWLARFNNEWQFETVATDEELWQTGTQEERKEVLLQVRNTNPARAREWLQAVWKQETANVKADFLQVFSEQLSEADMEWLEELVVDKSQKVKDAASALLSRIPASSVVQRYLLVARQSVALKKEKTMLGLSSKMVLQAVLHAGYDETIHKTGIGKTAADKQFTNEEWILYQLISHVPPQNWEVQLGDTAENIMALFARDKNTARYVPALAAAAGKFEDVRWGSALAGDEENFYVDVVPLLPPAEREKYLLKHLNSHPQAAIEQLTTMNNEWSHEIATAVFRYTAEAPYHYNRSFYSRYIHLFPLAIAGTLEQIMPKEAYQRSVWESHRDHIIRLLSLKQQIQQSF